MPGEIRHRRHEGPCAPIKSVPIIMLTALAEADSRIAGLEAGADDYLPKPFDPRELVLRINNILRRNASNDAPKIEQVMFGPYTFSLTRKELKKAGEVDAAHRPRTGNHAALRQARRRDHSAPRADRRAMPMSASERSTCRSTACAGRSRTTPQIRSGCRRCAASAIG